ncbi:MAG: S8 family peptidase [Gaiellaceae bacterium]
MRRLAVLAALFALCAAPAQAARGPMLVELNGASGAFALQASGGTLVSPSLRLWKVPGAAATRLVPRLRAAGTIRAVEPDRLLLRPYAQREATDPLVANEWWIPAIGAGSAVPPGPGIPVTVIDAGLDMTHPEFANRPNTTVLNQQTLVGEEEAHATAVDSVAAAPVNGIGVVGVYPQAALWAYDASPSDAIDEASVIRGIDVASRAGRGVINLSLGSADESEFMAQAIVQAFGRGSLVVVAAGNQFEQGNPLSYPAGDPHVLTVGATTESGTPAPFSSTSAALDLAAPGVDIPAAVPLADDPTGYTTVDGTSFSSPLVAGAAAWVWTQRPTLEKTQIFDLMRMSAKDVWSPGWDRDTGFGLLDIPNALTMAPPPVDPLEPNDDVDQVKARELFPVAKPLVTGTLHARAAAVDDPDDIYRVNVPPHGTLTAAIKADANLNLRLWGPLTRSVTETESARARDLLASSSRGGTQTDTVRWTNRGKKAVVLYADVFFPPGSTAPDVGYSLTVKTARAQR